MLEFSKNGFSLELDTIHFRNKKVFIYIIPNYFKVTTYNVKIESFINFDMKNCKIAMWNLIKLISDVSINDTI